MRDLRGASLRLIILMSIVASCGGATIGAMRATFTDPAAAAAL